MASWLIADDKVQVRKWLCRMLQRREHSEEEPLWLKMATCRRGDSARQIWRTQ